MMTVLKELLPLSIGWENIGALLGIPYEELEVIAHNWNIPSDCLREMIKVWLKMVDPEPTWERLVEAVEIIYPQQAQVIRLKHGMLLQVYGNILRVNKAISKKKSMYTTNEYQRGQ